MGFPDDLPWIGGEATHRADVADGIRGRGIGLAQGAVDGAGDLPSPFGVGSLGSYGNYGSYGCGPFGDLKMGD